MTQDTVMPRICRCVTIRMNSPARLKVAGARRK
ncbi:hypothetical protein AO056_01468 [Aeromonas hydrophila]|nr:hypothetical protein AO056_01468 [Aeromonas hydrophila]